MDTQFNTSLDDIVSGILASDELERKMSLETSELEQLAFEYILDCTPPDYALWTLDQTFVIVPRQIWQSSRTLISHSPVGKYHSVEWSFMTVENLKHLAQLKIFPRDLPRVLELIALVKYLDIPALLKVCYDHFCRGTALQGGQNVAICSASLPTTCSRGTILRIWELVCASPMRSKPIYHQYFKLLQDYCRDTEFLNLARKINKAKCKDYLPKNIEGLSIEFDRTAAVFGIFLIEGVPKTAVIGSGPLMVTDIFGNAFKKERQRTVRDFFLVYNRYIIYRDQYADVSYKALSLDTQPVKLASNITQFIHKTGHLFLVERSWLDQKNKILKWGGGAFHELTPLEPAGERLDFNADNNILCYETRQGDTLCLDHLGEMVLTPCRRIDHGCVHMFVFYQKQLYVWGKHVNRVYEADGRENGYVRVPSFSQAVSTCKVVSGMLYLKMADGWHTYREGRLHKFCSGNQLVAFEEVSLNPYLVANPI